MNYDRIAALKIDELRKEVRQIAQHYNELTGSVALAPTVVRHAPKARLLYILCRYMAEVDMKTKHKRMFEELAQREKMAKAPRKWEIYGGGDPNSFSLTIKEVS